MNIKKIYHFNLKEKDFDYTESTKNEIKESLYNGRTIVKNTHKQLL